MQVTSPVKRNVSWGPNSRREPALLPLHQSPHPSPKSNSHNSIIGNNINGTCNRSSVVRTASTDGLVSTTLRRGTRPHKPIRYPCESRPLLPSCLTRGLFLMVCLIVPTVLFLRWDRKDMLLHSNSTQSKFKTSLSAPSSSNLRRYKSLHNMPPTIQDLDLLNEQLCPGNTNEDAAMNSATAGILEWLRQQRYNVVQWNQFTVHGMVLLAETHQHELLLPVVSMDSLHQFAETYHLIQRIQNYYKDVNYQFYQPFGFTEKQAFDKHFGNIWRKDRSRYDYLTITEPLERALENVPVYLTADTRESTRNGELRCFELDNAGRLKINPLAYWTNAQIWNYVRTNRIPYNPLYDHGYSEIGDEMLTFKSKQRV
ncbi:hypothetical protein FisN_5Lh024 [Fistulifera solaris]|uniref:Phosphoadenosine phosphosulphate reductase domain-containing protein n=1 Tax=Fistulifera solaris TaxID=1519565 RepID=A0A1Z5JJN4_FISSO|nr:hypothetical protein FisN_5Lh024 [Fistulifera solaris]|eukprot:GAX14052.1 hypothetical protein FisN_5Lh024 [Fistulifera solaris]